MTIMTTDFRNYKKIVHIPDTRPSGSNDVLGIGDPGEEVEARLEND